MYRQKPKRIYAKMLIKSVPLDGRIIGGNFFFFVLSKMFYNENATNSILFYVNGILLNILV